ncbi:unnamed protein product [Bursaphelenchus okinawaensis]|uniref:Uncharacterized protein n=1 Tax=Bursaphelenchus okinawaensis TaxID=465554 RepID=A0A811KBA9_9BILA|nr:unnamed protein product [Bursaphelenchus okinawaensis]CAG9097144.1 unnamed protein product [Bursaphelenchus okinawaensis]
MHHTVVLLLLFLIKPAICAKDDSHPIPDSFVGTWIPSHDDNMEALLRKRGYGYSVGRILLSVTVKKKFEKTNSMFNVTLITRGKHQSWVNVTTNDMFVAPYLDGMHYYFLFDRSEYGLLLQIFFMDSSKLKEAVMFEYVSPFLKMHIKYDNVKACIYHYKETPDKHRDSTIEM